MKQILAIGAAAAALGAAFATAPASAQEPFIGEIRIMPYTFCPDRWAEASGQLLAISQNQALYSLYGTTYGGDGRSTFALPDLRGRAPINHGQGPGLSNYVLGQMGGTERVTLNEAQMPSHTHVMQATSSPPDTNNPQNAAFGTFPAGQSIYDDGGGALDHSLRGDMISRTGSSQAVENMQPYLVTRFCVALQGIYPSRP